MAAIDDVQDYLQAQSLVDGGTGWTSLRGAVRDIVHQLVTLSADAGPTPEFPADDGLGSAAVDDVGVLARVRAEPWDQDAASAKAGEIRAALHGLTDVTLGSTIYLRVRALTPEPVGPMYDDDHRPIYTIAFRLMRSAT